MATNHYDFNRNTQPGSELYDCLKQMATAWDRYTRLRGVLIQEKVNGASGSAVYADIATRYGFTDSAMALASFAEIDSAFGGDAAITQMLNRHLS